MVKPLREVKARLSEFVRSVRQGEEVLITARGEVVAKIVPAGRDLSAAETKKWAEELRSLQRKYTRRVTNSSERILAELREERQ